MSINRAEKRTLWVALAAIASFFVVQLFRGPLQGSLELNTMLFVHMVFEYITFSVCIAVQLLGWIFFVRSMSRHRLYMAGLFTIVGMLDLLHAVTQYGMPFFREFDGSSYTRLFGGLAQMLSAAGLFLIFRKDDKQITRFNRRKYFVGAVASGLAAAAVVVAGAQWGWFAGPFRDVMRVFYPVATMGGYLLTILVILYRNRSQKPQAQLTIIQGLVWLFFANLQYFLANTMWDADMLLGQAYKLAGYFFLMKGIYYVTIEEPMKQQRRAEAQINYMAYHDDLTGLGNRRLLVERLTAELNRAGLNGKSLAVLLLDIDRFKTINDSLGHTFGDMLLQSVADRLRDAAPRPDRVYRMGGDEFTIVLADQNGTDDASASVAAIMKAFSTPIRLEGAEYHVTVSAGMAVFPQDGDNVDLLVKNADTAMYSAKTERNAFRRFAADMSLKADKRLQVENDLRKAMEKEQFVLMYQPLVELETGSVVGVEALVRWIHPQKGLILPSEFIPVCEENGLIIPLGDWVLRTACLQNKAWQDSGLPPIIMSVNLSMRQFRQPQLVERIKEILDETGLSPDYLELEITESMTENVEYAIATLTALKTLGVRISIDDFGTGYSSLIYLKKFPIDKLKIDRSFVTDLEDGGSDAAIITTIAAMARHMKLKVTAEGVENSDQLAFLKDQRCEEAQGYYFTRPIPAEEFVQWCRDAKLAG